MFVSQGISRNQGISSNDQELQAYNWDSGNEVWPPRWSESPGKLKQTWSFWFCDHSQHSATLVFVCHYVIYFSPSSGSRMIAAPKWHHMSASWNFFDSFQGMVFEVSLIRWSVASRPGFLEKNNWIRDTLINACTLFVNFLFILQFKCFIYLATTLGVSEHLVKKNTGFNKPVRIPQKVSADTGSVILVTPYAPALQQVQAWDHTLLSDFYRQCKYK